MKKVLMGIVALANAIENTGTFGHCVFLMLLGWLGYEIVHLLLH